MNIGQRVFDLRKQVGLNQAEFGKRIGVTRSAICNYENGSRSIGEQTILSICREFNVNEAWLRTGEGGDDAMFVPKPNDTLGAFIRERNLTPTDQILIEKFASLNATAREEVVNYVLKIAEALLDTRKPSLAQTDDVPKQKADAAAAEVHKQVFLEEKAKAESSASPSDTGGTAGEKMA